MRSMFVFLLIVATSRADVCGDAYSSQSTCDANSTCTWCKCGALPSACWTKENAKKLPAGVYICDSTFSAKSAAKPVFDGTFGANCPPCKEFGQTVLKKLYAADGIAAAVDFEMHSAIRSAGDPSTDHTWNCPDEDDGCPMTKWFICAVDGWNKTTTTQDQQVNFLTCWDDSTGTLESRTKQCAESAGLDYDAIKTCATGSKAGVLQQAAAQDFETRFPSHAHSGMYEVPHIFINGKDMAQNRDYDTILQTLCATGIEAGACK